jgi:hypothetical protein
MKSMYREFSATPGCDSMAVAQNVCLETSAGSILYHFNIGVSHPNTSSMTSFFGTYHEDNG